MSDLMKTPSNRRYMINFQQKEPINKYDIWLSMNRHELEENEVLDSELLQDTDLVLKVFMNGKWRPIWGLPLNYEGILEVMKKKINLVPKFKNGNLAVFKQGPDECDQLVDGGSLIEILEKLIQGGEQIPITRATPVKLGGIKAETAVLADNQDTIVEAKFKGPDGTTYHNNDKIGILISEMYNSLKVYLQNKEIYFPVPLMSPTLRGGAKSNAISGTPLLVLPVYVDGEEKLQVDGSEIKDFVEHLIPTIIGDIDIYEAGDGIDISEEKIISNKQATDTTTGGVRVDNWTQNALLKGIGVEVYYGNNSIRDVITDEPIDIKHLCITQEQLWALLNYQDEYTDPMFRTGFGIQPHAHHDEDPHTGVYDDYYTFDLIYSAPDDFGKYLKIKSDGSGTEWANIPVNNYEVLNENTLSGTECVVAAPDKKEGFLRWDGTFVSIPVGSTVAWNQILNAGTKIAEITIDSVTTDIFAPNDTTYTAGLGITIDSNNNNSINIDTTGAQPDEVLSWDGQDFDWVPLPTQIQYEQREGAVVDNVNHTIGGMITVNETHYIAERSLTFNCTYGTMQNPITGIEAVIDTIHYDLFKYSYNEIEIDTNNNSVTLEFNVSYQKTYMAGIPIYVLLTVDGKVDDVVVSVADSDSLGLVNINEAVSKNYLNASCLNPDYSKFLVTMQFGIVRIEPLEGTTKGNI